MPIKGMTDRESIVKKLPRLGKLRKGDEKPANSNKPGKDLPHFRFTSDYPEVLEAFESVYGKEPKLVNVVLWFDRLEENFSSWIEAWDASGMVMRSDGEQWHIWREGAQYKRGKKPHQDVDKQFSVGRFEFIIPELVQQGFRGTVTLETHSKHDLLHIPSMLLTAEEERGGSLRGARFVMRRVAEEISVPGWGDRADKRSKATKYLVKLELPREIFAGVLGGSTPERPALTQGRPALTADPDTGEILDDAPEFVEGEVVDHNPEDTLTSKGLRLGDQTQEKLLEMITWAEDNGKTDDPLIVDARTVFEARQAEEAAGEDANAS